MNQDREVATWNDNTREIGNMTVKMNLLWTMSSVLVACGSPADDATPEELTTLPAATPCDYTQAFGNSTHTGIACPEIRGMRVVAKLSQDPDADAENAFSGFLQIHESPPLTSGDFVVVPGKSGFVDGFDRSPETWNVSTYRWVPSVTASGALLVPAWSTRTTWQPVDAIIGSFGSYTNGYVAQFAPAIANGSLYMPSRFGRLARLNLATGATVASIDPLVGTAFSGDEKTLVTNAVSADKLGNVYYTVTAFPIDGNRGAAPRGSWLVKVRPDNTTTLVNWEALAVAAGAPGRNDLCEYPFGTGGTADAVDSTSKAPLFHCGPQRPAFNSPVAISDDATKLVAFSYANNAQGAAFLVTINANTLAPTGAFDTRGRALHGCGVRLPDDAEGDQTGTLCSTITDGGLTHHGFDPDFNLPVRFLGEDLMDSAPVIAPNGDVSIGSYDGGFSFGGGYDARGFGVVFNATGGLVAKNQDFWWEVTPSVQRHADGSFSYLADRNLYSDLDLSVATYSPTMGIQAEGAIAIDDTAVAIDWLDAHILFDSTGRHYAVNGSGEAVAFDSAGNQVDSVTLTDLDGVTVRSMETLSGYGARDRAGRLYLSYSGIVYVIEGGAPSPAPAASRSRRLTGVAPAARARLISGMDRKRAGVAGTAIAPPQ